MQQELKPGETVLVRGIVGRDCIVLGHGVEVGQGALDIVGEVPRFDQDRQPVMVMLFFSDRMECQRSMAKIANDPAVDVLYVESDD